MYGLTLISDFSGSLTLPEPRPENTSLTRPENSALESASLRLNMTTRLAVDPGVGDDPRDKETGKACDKSFLGQLPGSTKLSLVNSLYQLYNK